MKKLLFKIQEATWWIVAELEDWLYPYRDREITSPLWDTGKSYDVDEISYLKSQIEANQERVERLQSEMLWCLAQIHNITGNKSKYNLTIRPPNEGQEGSEVNHQTSKKTP